MNEKNRRGGSVRRSKNPTTFRVGSVRGDLRGKTWYLTYHEAGRRRRPRVGPSLEDAQALAAQVNAQLAAGAPAALSFEAVTIPELRRLWLDHHEHVLRSSVATIARYRTATDHLLRFLTQADQPRSLRSAADFHAADAERLVRYLRTVEVAPNGHPNAAKRRLLDSGVKYVLETCRALFNFAAKRRHLPPYAGNPFADLGVERLPVEDTKPVLLLTADQEREFFAACDDWQFPLFLTLALTGLRPGELVHLLLPEDLDLDAGVLRIRNKPTLGWKVKTRSERDVPLLPVLTDVLRRYLGERRSGPLFVKRALPGESWTRQRLERAVTDRLREIESARDATLDRRNVIAAAKSAWRAAGGLKEDRVRQEFIRLTRSIGLPHLTAPKLFRHQFATALQEGRVDPLIRNELMGHAPASHAAGGSLGMTAHYTRTRPETRYHQLCEALAGSPAATAAAARLVRG